MVLKVYIPVRLVNDSSICYRTMAGRRLREAVQQVSELYIGSRQVLALVINTLTRLAANAHDNSSDGSFFIINTFNVYNGGGDGFDDGTKLTHGTSSVDHN